MYKRLPILGIISLVFVTLWFFISNAEEDTHMCSFKNAIGKNENINVVEEYGISKTDKIIISDITQNKIYSANDIVIIDRKAIKSILSMLQRCGKGIPRDIIYPYKIFFYQKGIMTKQAYLAYGEHAGKYDLSIVEKPGDSFYYTTKNLPETIGKYIKPAPLLSLLTDKEKAILDIEIKWIEEYRRAEDGPKLVKYLIRNYPFATKTIHDPEKPSVYSSYDTIIINVVIDEKDQNKLIEIIRKYMQDNGFTGWLVSFYDKKKWIEK